MSAQNGRLLHIGFHYQLPMSDTKVLEGVVTAYAEDWIRYSSHCYLVWTQHEPDVWANALLAVPHVNQSLFLVLTVDLNRSLQGWLPRWIWEWVYKYTPGYEQLPPPHSPTNLSGQ